ncbi:hypothetical protein [Stenotrophomonas phage StenR_269]|nr:hypothetical protein [Stenotrophomonas phage StenR_269]
MPRLHHSEVEYLISEAPTCQGCDRDTLDCMCMESYEDLYHYAPDDREYLESVDQSFDNVDDDHAAYLQAAWEFEYQRSPLEGI